MSLTPKGTPNSRTPIRESEVLETTKGILESPLVADNDDCGGALAKFDSLLFRDKQGLRSTASGSRREKAQEIEQHRQRVLRGAATRSDRSARRCEKNTRTSSYRRRFAKGSWHFAVFACGYARVAAAQTPTLLIVEAFATTNIEIGDTQ